MQDFNLQEERIVCHHTNTVLWPEDLMIDKVYRFEGALVNYYGISADASTNAIIAKLKTHAEGLVKPSFIKK